MKKLSAAAVVSLTVMLTGAMAPAHADSISPGIRDSGKQYSEDLPDTSYYGTGIGAIQTEASELRFGIERALQHNRIEEALVKAKKCAQMDPSDPINHLLLARCLTKKFNSIKGPVDEKLLAECLYEWKLIWHHDVDQFNQAEAKINARRLMRIAKGLQLQREAEAKLEQMAREEAKKQMAKEGKKKLAENAGHPSNASNSSAAANDKKQLASTSEAVPANVGASPETGQSKQPPPRRNRKKFVIF